MYKIYLLYILIWTGSQLVQAQEVTYLDLNTCYQQAEQQFHLSDQRLWAEQVSQEAIGKVNAGWQPQVYLNAQATYQSDVPGIPIESPFFEMPTVPKDQYRATIDISQLLYDGGQLRQQKSIQELNGALEKARTESNFYPIYQQIDQLYCGILLARENQLLILNLKKDLENKESQLRTAWENGATTEMALRTIQAELLKIEQRLQEARFTEQGLLEMLSIITGLTIDGNTQLLLPAILPTEQSAGILRPEIDLFAKQLAISSAQQDFATSINLPKVSVFAQGGYGNPALNFLLDEFDTFYMLGIRLQYPLWMGGTHGHEAELYQINQQIINQQKNNFITSTSAQAAQQLNEMEKLKAALEKDNEIIQLLEDVLRISSVMLENGSSTAADYSRDANAVLQAQLNKQLHETQLIYAQLQYQNIKGIK